MSSGDDLSSTGDLDEVIELYGNSEPREGHLTTGEAIEDVPVVDEDDGNGGGDNTDDNEDKEKEEKKKVKRVRNPQPKLNVETLKGPKGLRHLQDLCTKVKFKGTDREHDLNVLMKTYEYWFHRMFPKLPFDNCIEKLEKLGTQKAVQTLLKRIRMDLVLNEDEGQIDDNDREGEEIVNEPVTHDVFEDLISQNAPLPDIAQPAEVVQHSEDLELSEQQLERIKLNQEKAKRIREERLMREQSTQDEIDMLLEANRVDMQLPLFSVSSSTRTAQEEMENLVHIVSDNHESASKSPHSEIENVQVIEEKSSEDEINIHVTDDLTTTEMEVDVQPVSTNIKNSQ